jgi:hypothetical protein
MAAAATAFNLVFIMKITPLLVQCEKNKGGCPSSLAGTCISGAGNPAAFCSAKARGFPNPPRDGGGRVGTKL